MPSFEVAHIREQGIDLIIIPLKNDFGQKGHSTQEEIVEELQLHASSAGLAGTVVPVWQSSGGRMGFIAPSNWHPFFKGLNLNFIARNINKKITW
jgi:hypothetical protein